MTQPLFETETFEEGRQDAPQQLAAHLALVHSEAVSLPELTAFCYPEDTEVAAALEAKERKELLTAAEEVLLAKRIEAGVLAQETVASWDEIPADFRRVIAIGLDAKERFIEANQRLVVSIAKHYPRPKGMDLDDLVQEGNFGLNRAVEKFDWRRGHKFSTYATRWIKQSLQRTLAQKGSLIRLPGDRRNELKEAKRRRDTEGVPLSADQAEWDRMVSLASLDAPVGEEDDFSLKDTVASRSASPEEAVLLNEITPDGIENSLYKALEERQQNLRNQSRLRGGYKKAVPPLAAKKRVDAVMIYFGFRDDGERQSLKEVGRRLGISQEAANKLIKSTILFAHESEELRSYFEVMAGQQR